MTSRAGAGALLPEIDVEAFKLLRTSENTPLVLDVREPEELKIARLPESLDIPLMDLADRLGEIEDALAQKASTRIVVICRSGQRSALAVQYLIANGYDGALNLKGGIKRYAELVDSSIPVY